MTDALRWHVVHTHPRAERVAVSRLARQGFKPLLPEYSRRRRHARRTEWIRTPLFSRYLVVAIGDENARWRNIMSTVGVSHLVCNGTTPIAVPSWVIDDIRSRMDADGLVSVESDVLLSHGDFAQVTSGPLTDQIGIFQAACDEDRAILLLDLLGRQVKTKLPLEILAPLT